MSIEAKRPMPKDEPRPEKTNPQTTRHSSRRRILSIRTLVITIVLVVIVAPTMWLVHRVQVRRIATVFLDRATELEQKQEWEKAAARIANYLRLHPQDRASRIRLAEVYAKSVEAEPSNRPRAAALLFRAVGVAEGETKINLRRELGQMLVELGRHQSAQDLMVQQPRRDEPDSKNRYPLAHAQDLRILAMALYYNYRDGIISGQVKLTYTEDAAEEGKSPAEIYAIAEIVELAIEQNTTDADLARVLAQLYRRHPETLTEEHQKATAEQRNQLADGVMDTLVAKASQDYMAFLARFDYRSVYYPERADEDLKTALGLAPDNINVLLIAADRARDRADFLKFGDAKSRVRDEVDDALASIGALPQEVVDQVHQDSADELAQAEAKRLSEEAGELYGRVLELAPNNVEALLGLGFIALMNDESEKAIETWKMAADHAPNSIPVQIALADAHRVQKQFPIAMACLDAAESIINVNSTRTNRTQNSLLMRQVRLLRGRILIDQKLVAAALPHLRDAATVDAETVSEDMSQAAEQLSFTAHGLLAASYASLAQWELAARELEELASRQTDSMEVVYRMAAASAWLISNSADDALRNLDVLTGRYELAEIWFRVAHARLTRELQQLPDERDWERIEAAIARCRAFEGKEALLEPWRLVMLEAELTIAKTQGANREAVRAAVGEIVQKMRAAEEQFRTNAAFLAKLAPTYARLGLSDEADRVLAALERAQPGAVSTALVKAELLEQRGETDEARRVLSESLKMANESEKAQVQLSLLQLDDAPDASEAKAYFEDPKNNTLTLIRMALQMADAALTRKDWKQAEQWENELRELEGIDGIYWRVNRARRLLATSPTKASTSKDREVLQEVEELQEFVVRRRPNWALAHTLKGAVELRQGRTQAGIESLLRAVALGERRSDFLEDLCLLLYQQNRLSDADRILSMIDKEGPKQNDLAEVEFEVARRQGEAQRALQIAERQLLENPSDAETLLRLGQAQMLTKDLATAEKTLRQAVDADPANPKAWVVLFHLLVRNDRQIEARQTLEDLLAKADFAPSGSGAANASRAESNRALIAAQCYELLGETENAAKSYALAAAANQDNVASLMQLALFRRRQRDWSGAIDALQRASKLEPNNLNVKRVLAAAYFARGREQDIDTAINLVEGDEEQTISDSTDQHLKALLLSRYTGPAYRDHLNDAERLLHRLVESPTTATPGNRALLTRVLITQALFESDPLVIHQKYREAEAIFGHLMRGENASPSLVLSYAHFLLLQNKRPDAQALLRSNNPLTAALKSDTRGALAIIAQLNVMGFEKEALAALVDFEKRLASQTNHERNLLSSYIDLSMRLRPDVDIEPWLNVLDELSAAAKDFGALELRTRWLHQRGRTQEIPGVVDAFVSKYLVDPANLRRKDALYVTVGNLYYAAEMLAEADKAFQLANPDLLQAIVGRMRIAAKQQQWEQAAEFCQTAIDKAKSPQPASLLVDLLTNSPDSQGSIAVVEKLLEKARSDHAEDTGLLVSLSNLRIRQQRAEEAVGLLESALAIRSRNPIALNNLAALLAEIPGREREALDYVNQAIQLAGPTASMLDTKGVVALYLQQSSEAIRLFQSAANLDSTTPIYEFHLAVAYDRAGSADEARVYFESAIRDGIEGQILTPADQRILGELRARYAAAGAAESASSVPAPSRTESSL